MEIKFVLPPNYNQPVGGYKIIFQYANWLSLRGHEVHIYFINFREYIGKKELRWIKRKIFKQSTPTNKITWFDLESNIRIHYNVSYKEVEQLNSGILVATFWRTAISVLKSRVPLKNKYYFIQGYETFSTSEKNIVKTWHYPLKKLVVSNWLVEKADQLNEKVLLVPNFINDSAFYPVSKNIVNPTVSMLWHDNPHKGSKIGLQVLKKIKKEVPDLHAIFFGKNSFPDVLPDWITYYENASADDLRTKIYGYSTVYLMPSEFEGWGLTAMEAMAVGTPVISFENGGIRNFADETSAVLVPLGDINLLENLLKKLLHDEKKQALLKKNAMNMVKEYTINNSGFLLESIFYEG